MPDPASQQQQYQMPLPLSQVGLAPYNTVPTNIPEGTVYTTPVSNGSPTLPHITHKDAALSKNPAELVRQQQLAKLHQLPPGTTMQEYSPSIAATNSTTTTVPATTQNLSPAAPASQPQHLQPGRAATWATPTPPDNRRAPMKEKT